MSLGLAAALGERTAPERFGAQAFPLDQIIELLSLEETLKSMHSNPCCGLVPPPLMLLRAPSVALGTWRDEALTTLGSSDKASLLFK